MSRVPTGQHAKLTEFPELVSTADFCRTIGISVATASRMRKDGGGPPFIRLSPARYAYRRDDILTWLDEAVTATSAVRAKAS